MSLASRPSYQCVVAHPALLGIETPAGKEYLDAKFGTGTEDYIVLSDRVDWQREVLASIDRICERMCRGTHDPLRFIAEFASLCACIGEHIQPGSLSPVEERSWPVVWNMTGFVQKNYGDSISLDDIAAAGSVCRSKCCRLFNEYVGQTPNAYLSRYRIGKSREMLRETSMSVIEIAMACGFQSSSYFTQIFQRETGLTPRKYRENIGSC